MRCISRVLVCLSFSQPCGYPSHPERGSLHWDSIWQDGHLQGRLALSVTPAPDVCPVSALSPRTSARLARCTEAHTPQRSSHCYVTRWAVSWIGEVSGIFSSRSPGRCYSRLAKVMMSHGRFSKSKSCCSEHDIEQQHLIHNDIKNWCMHVSEAWFKHIDVVTCFNSDDCLSKRIIP